MSVSTGLLSGTVGLPGGWVAWRGVNGLWYARLPRSSPPLVARAATRRGLPAAVREAAGERARLRRSRRAAA
jgi:hypothetical protein